MKFFHVKAYIHVFGHGLKLIKNIGVDDYKEAVKLKRKMLKRGNYSLVEII